MQDQFSKIRNLFWPIHNYELKKFLPMGLMMFCALFNYTIVRDIKDALVVKAAGAETISFIKFWIVMPFAVLFVILYTKASNKLSKEQLFYYTILPFIIFFASFGFILYPMKEYLLPSQETIASLISAAPPLRWFIMMYAHWIYVIFYAFAELWGSVVIALLFWQFANQITRVFEAKRYYAMFGLVGNFGLILSGQTLKWISYYGQHIVGDNGNPFDITLKYILSAFTAFGILFMYLYYWLNKNVLTNPKLCNIENSVKIKKEKKKTNSIRKF
jgi:AAA family ATP:ADP antiporter